MNDHLRNLFAAAPPGQPLLGDNILFFAIFGGVLLLLLLLMVWLRRRRRPAVDPEQAGSVPDRLK